MSYLDKNGLAYFWSKIKTLLNGKVDKVDGKGLSTNDYTTTEKNKLSGIASGAEVNQNAFSNIVVGSTTIAADTKTDSLTLVAGSNVTLTPDATNDKLTIAATAGAPIFTFTRTQVPSVLPGKFIGLPDLDLSQDQISVLLEYPDALDVRFEANPQYRLLMKMVYANADEYSASVLYSGHDTAYYTSTYHQYDEINFLFSITLYEEEIVK